MTRKEIQLALSRINIASVKTYLTENGWSFVFYYGENRIASIWHREDDDEAEILLPNPDIASDAVARLVDMIIYLSEYNKKPIRKIIESIENLSNDIFQVRVIHDDVKDGVISLEDGVLLHQKALDLMTSSAQSSLAKKTVFTGKKPTEVSNYLSRLQLGQSKVGSYIVNIIVPLEKHQDDNLSTDGITFSRVVTDNLINALDKLSTAVTKYNEQQDVDIFLQTIEAGVSKNLCEALIGLSGRNKQRSFQITAIPSTTQKMPRPELPLTFDFDIKAVSALTDAIDFFTTTNVYLNQELCGQVVHLDRNPGADSGTIAILAKIPATPSDQEKKIHIELNEKDYKLAIEAHRQKQYVTCVGDVIASNHSAKVTQLNEFKVHVDDDLLHP